MQTADERLRVVNSGMDLIRWAYGDEQWVELANAFPQDVPHIVSTTGEHQLLLPLAMGWGLASIAVGCAVGTILGGGAAAVGFAATFVGGLFGGHRFRHRLVSYLDKPASSMLDELQSGTVVTLKASGKNNGAKTVLAKDCPAEVRFTSTGVVFGDSAFAWRSESCRFTDVVLIQSEPDEHLYLRLVFAVEGSDRVLVVPVPDKLRGDVREMTELLVAKTGRELPESVAEDARRFSERDKE